MRLLLLLVVTGLFGALTPAAGAAGWSVDMLEHDFIPRAINITVGDSVTWTNQEPHEDLHTVTSDEPGRFDSGPIGPGESFSLQFNQAGNFPYFCEVHGREMTGIVRVRSPGVPFAADDVLTITTDQGSTDSVTATIDVLANDTDPDGDPLTIQAYDATTAAGASITCSATGECVYTDPQAVCPAQDSFSYSIGDGTGNSDTALVFVDVACRNAPPTDVVTSIGLALRRHIVAKGVVSSERHSCEEFRLVKLQRKTSRGWKTLTAARTGHDGAYRIRVKDKPGRYRAAAPPAQPEGGDRCLKGVSDIRRHRH